MSHVCLKSVSPALCYAILSAVPQSVCPHRRICPDDSVAHAVLVALDFPLCLLSGSLSPPHSPGSIHPVHLFPPRPRPIWQGFGLSCTSRIMSPPRYPIDAHTFWRSFMWPLDCMKLSLASRVAAPLLSVRQDQARVAQPPA